MAGASSPPRPPAAISNLPPQSRRRIVGATDGGRTRPWRPSRVQPVASIPYVGRLLQRYASEVVPRKRGADREVYMLRVILRHPIGRISMHRLTATEIVNYRDHRPSLVKSDTVRRELAIVRYCLEVARNEWGFVMSSNPVQPRTLPGMFFVICS